MKTYKIKYITKRGLHVTMFTPSILDVKQKITSCFKQHVEATATDNNGDVVGNVWRDATQKPMWNYSILPE